MCALTNSSQAKISEPHFLDSNDATKIAALEKICFSRPWSATLIYGAFKQKNFAVAGIFAEYELIAYLSVFHTEDEVEILNFAVRPEWRRQGYAKNLLSYVLNKAWEKGVQRAVLEVRVGNFPAIALYEKMGFVQVGRRPHYYPDTNEDALIYSCHHLPKSV